MTRKIVKITLILCCCLAIAGSLLQKQWLLAMWISIALYWFLSSESYEKKLKKLTEVNERLVNILLAEGKLATTLKGTLNKKHRKK